MPNHENCEEYKNKGVIFIPTVDMILSEQGIDIPID